MIRHTITLTNGETETVDYDNVIDSQEGFCEESKRGDVVNISIKLISKGD